MEKIIQNLEGSSKQYPYPPFPFTSHLQYCEFASCNFIPDNEPYQCPACGKYYFRKDLDGCHVRKVNDSDNSRVYLIIMCKKCNHRTDNFKILDSSLLIPIKKNIWI